MSVYVEGWDSVSILAFVGLIVTFLTWLAVWKLVILYGTIESKCYLSNLLVAKSSGAKPNGNLTSLIRIAQVYQIWDK